MGFAETQVLAMLRAQLNAANGAREAAAGSDPETRASLDAGIASLEAQIAVLERGGSLGDLAQAASSAAAGDDADAVPGAWQAAPAPEAPLAGSALDSGAWASVGGPAAEAPEGGALVRRWVVAGVVLVALVVVLVVVVRAFMVGGLSGTCSVWSPGTGWQTYDGDDPVCDD